MLIRKLISTEIWEPRGLETYLTEMEADGLRLVKATGWFLYFEQAEPRHMRYRVEYIRHPDEELLALYDDCGWEYVTETNREVQIFRAPEDTDIPEIHTDAESEANMYRHVKQAARNSFLMAALLSIFLGWMLVVRPGGHVYARSRVARGGFHRADRACRLRCNRAL